MFDTWSRLVVHVAMDNTVVIEEISEYDPLTDHRVRSPCQLTEFPPCRAPVHALAGRRLRSISWRLGAQRLPGRSVCPGGGGDGALETSGAAHPAETGPERHKRGLHRHPQGERCRGLISEQVLFFQFE